MDEIKVAIIYYSATGANFKMSKWAAMAAEKEGALVRRHKIKETAPREAIESNDAWKKFVENSVEETEATLDDLGWADVIIWSIPTRYGSWPSQAQAFIDTTGGLWSEGKLADKVVTAISSAMNPHGGQEGTVKTIYATMMHWGCIIVPTGYTDDAVFAAGGNPYGTTASVDQDGFISDEEQIKAAIQHQVKRAIVIGRKIAG